MIAIDNCLEDRIISYFDILGFQNKIKNTDEPELCEKMNKIFLTLEKLQKKSQESFGHKFQLAFFSDSIVISSTLKKGKGNEGRSEEFIVFATHSLILSDFISEGLFVRGGIAKGRCHHDGNKLFGQGYLHAYDLGEKVACVPRIVVDKSIVESLEKNHKIQKNFYLKHNIDDDIWFINLFKVGYPDVPPEEDVLTHKLSDIRYHICSEFKKSSKSCDIKYKYRWLSTQFNISLGEYKKDGYLLSNLNDIDLDKIC